MISNISPINFKGKVVFEGSAKELEKIGEYYDKAYYGQKEDKIEALLDRFELRKEADPDTFYDLESRHLTGIYNENQEFAQDLYVTNEDTPKLRAFFVAHQNDNKLKKCTSDMGITELLNNMFENKKIIEQELQKYTDASKSKDSFADFMIDLYLKAQKELAEIFGDKASEVKTIKAADALDAMENGKFDYKKCEIIA